MRPAYRGMGPTVGINARGRLLDLCCVSCYKDGGRSSGVVFQEGSPNHSYDALEVTKVCEAIGEKAVRTVR